MSKRTHQESVDSSLAEPANEAVRPNPCAAPPEIIWSKTWQRIATIALLVYLGVLLLGPMSNPIAPTHLVGPLADGISPVHRVLFQGHGYRFFAPDPGPSHRLVFRGTRADGSEFSGHFPDREGHWPRLLYHRWFMLSERISFEQSLRTSDQQFQEIRQQYDQEILNFHNIGKLKLSRQLTRERDQGIEMHERNQRRFEILGGAIAQVLLDRNQGDRIELFVQERSIPFPVQVANGARLVDEQFLTELIEIGNYDSSGFHPGVIQEMPVLEETP